MVVLLPWSQSCWGRAQQLEALKFSIDTWPSLHERNEKRLVRKEYWKCSSPA